jgi:hypothetical protein
MTGVPLIYVFDVERTCVSISFLNGVTVYWIHPLAVSNVKPEHVVFDVHALAQSKYESVASGAIRDNTSVAVPDAEEISTGVRKGNVNLVESVTVTAFDPYPVIVM